MTDKIEYKIVEPERRPGETEVQSAERTLNFHAQAAWQLDRFYDAGEPPTRYFLLRRTKSK